MKKAFLNRGSTHFLRFVIFLLGIAVLALCIFVLPNGIRTDQTGDYGPILLGMYLPTIPFFIALFQGLKLLNPIDKNKAFSDSAVRALKYIKYCAFSITVMYALGMPYIFYVAQKDDAPGVVLIGLIFTFGPLVVAVAAALLQNLLKNAIDIKSENDQII